MNIASLSLLGFDGISDGEIALPPGAPLVVSGGVGAGKSRLAAAILAVADEIGGRSIPSDLLSGAAGKVRIRWAFGEDDLTFVSPGEDATTEIFVGSHPERTARAERDVGLALARKQRFSALGVGADRFATLPDGARERVVDHLLGVEASDEVERWIELVGRTTPVAVGRVRRVGRGYVPVFDLGGRQRGFEELPRTYRVALAMAAVVALTRSSLLLLDDADELPRALLDMVVHDDARQTIVFSRTPLGGAWPVHTL